MVEIRPVEILLRVFFMSLLLVLLVVGRSQEVSQPPVISTIPPPTLPTATPAISDGSDKPDDSGTEDTMRFPIVVEGVEVVVLESYPYQLRLNVNGYIQDGCNYPVQVEQRRDGNTVTVDIFRMMPLGIICPMVVGSYQQAIALDGGFESGHYTIRVNDHVTEIDL